tara:strand:- start:161 stop:802 length:642 start_codon:yes stop_codon:yes gene_type:complete
MSLKILQGVTVPQRKRLSELGYTNDDIKDLQQNPQKLNQIIEQGTVKTGATDQQIARQQAKDLRIKNNAIRTRDANQEHVTNWLAKLKKQGINISEATLREAIKSGDVKTFLGSKGISAGGGDTTIPFGVLNSMENVMNYETKYESKKEEVKPEVKPDFQGWDWKLDTEVNKIDNTIKSQDTKVNNQSLTIPVSKNKDHTPINNNNKELSIVK